MSVCVARYFGGTKLGTGGLVRAYGGSAREGLRLTLRTELIDIVQLEVSLPVKTASIIYQTIAWVESQQLPTPGNTHAITKLSEDYTNGGTFLIIFEYSVPNTQFYPIFCLKLSPLFIYFIFYPFIRLIRPKFHLFFTIFVSNHPVPHSPIQVPHTVPHGPVPS